MGEGQEFIGRNIESVTLGKETSSSFTLGENGPRIDVVPDEESPTGLSAITPTEGKVFLKEGQNTVGRLAENDIVINIPTVSRRHASINVGDTEYSINDLGSTNGTKIAG